MADELDARRSEYVPWTWCRETVNVGPPKGHRNVHLSCHSGAHFLAAFHFTSDFSCSPRAFRASPFPPKHRQVSSQPHRNPSHQFSPFQSYLIASSSRRLALSKCLIRERRTCFSARSLKQSPASCPTTDHGTVPNRSN